MLFFFFFPQTRSNLAYKLHVKSMKMMISPSICFIKRKGRKKKTHFDLIDKNAFEEQKRNVKRALHQPHRPPCLFFCLYKSKFSFLFCSFLLFCRWMEINIIRYRAHFCKNRKRVEEITRVQM
ncbi:hypothetical protein IC575_018756 [Cucumis melo]